MANQLTKKQENFLTTVFTDNVSTLSFDMMEFEDQEKLLSMSDHENVYSDTDRYLSDLMLSPDFNPHINRPGKF